MECNYAPAVIVQWNTINLQRFLYDAMFFLSVLLFSS